MDLRLPPLSKARGKRPVTSGLGTVFTSPIRRQTKKTKIFSRDIGDSQTAARLRKELALLKGKLKKKQDSPPASDLLIDEPLSDDDNPSDPKSDWVDEPDIVDAPKPPRRILPNSAAHRLYYNWKILIPQLVDPLNNYLSSSIGKPVQPIPYSIHPVCTQSCILKSTIVTALFYDRFEQIKVSGCQCQSIFQVLVTHGLFPTSPIQPRQAVSIDLITFYACLFERSCDAVTALTAALNSFYIRRGYRMKDKNDEASREPFRRGISYAVQWYDATYIALQKRVEDSILEALDTIRDAKASQSQESALPIPSLLPAFDIQVLPEDAMDQDLASIPPAAPAIEIPSAIPPTPPASSTSNTAATPPLTRSECARILQTRCPCCFGGIEHGRPIRECDFHVSTDGAFHYRHARCAGDSPHFYDPSYFISKDFVDSVGERIEKERKRPAKPYKPKVPHEAVNQCAASYEAADGNKVKTSTDRYDDTGLMALVCRHDIPLFFANIDTPGEQQKYSIALIEHLFSLIPKEATVACLYDVGCVLDRSLCLYDFLPDDITSRLIFATSVMHAYGHQWACQLVYNPRLREGLGLSEGEGTERLWSRLRKLIGPTRSSARTRRLWVIDRQAHAIALELRDDLGDWLLRRLRRGVEGQGTAAKKALAECGVQLSVLRDQWALQLQSQLSLRAHAPARIKKQLDIILTLQGDLETMEASISTARLTISKSGGTASSIKQFETLEKTHDLLKDHVESLYSSLNITDTFPELYGISIEFFRLLLMARDLKINIQTRAIGSFFEWDKLDRASGGANPALGTKLHQQTRKAITRRRPALMAAIRKFNSYCTKLEELNNPEWNIPTPTPLPTELAKLRDDSTLMEDVWISPSPVDIPRWIDDVDVRQGIRAMLKVDRCQEERLRLGIEADNLCRWFGRELAAIELALATPSNHLVSALLQQRRDSLLALKTRWSNPLASLTRFDSHVAESRRLAASLSGTSVVPDLTWETIIITADDEDEDEPDQGTKDEISAPMDDISLPVPSHDVGTHLMAEIMDQEYCQLLEDTDTMTVTATAVIDWTVPDINLTSDPDFIGALAAKTSQIPFAQPQYHGRCFQDVHNTSRYFAKADIDRLADSTALLNDVCLNEGAALLQQVIAETRPDARNYAILSTFCTQSIRSTCSDPQLWRMTFRTEYWNKPIWIIPIHRSNPAHWVMCVADIPRHNLFLYDSLAEQKPWKRDLKDIMVLLNRMILLANKHGHAITPMDEDWIAQPLSITQVQTNGWDCGVWVLAVIAAVLRGYSDTGLEEKDMPTVRHHLYNLVYSLPDDVV